MPQLVVATAIFGGYDDLKEVCGESPNVRWVCFSDEEQKADVWQTEIIDPGQSDRRLNAYYCKILLHRLLDAEVVLWVDANYRLLVDPEAFAKKYLAQHDFASFRHFSRDCVYEEAEACIRFKRFTPSEEAIRAQVTKYKAEGYPKDNGLIEGCVVLRRMTPEVVDFCERWWVEALSTSTRMQISFNYMCWKLGLKYEEIPVAVYRKAVKHSRHKKGDPKYGISGNASAVVPSGEDAFVQVSQWNGGEVWARDSDRQYRCKERWVFALPESGRSQSNFVWGGH